MTMTLKRPSSRHDPDFVSRVASHSLKKKAASLATTNTPLEELPVAERLRLLQELTDLEKELQVKYDEAVAADPFWHFEPTDGTVSTEGQALIEKYIKPIDRPSRFDSQLDALISDAEIRGVFGGNQSGKSTTGCIEAFIHITGEVPFPLKGVYPESKLPKKYPFHVRVTGEDYENAVIGTLIPTYAKWAPREYLIDQDWDKSFSVSNSTLTLVKDGRVRGTVEFYSNKQEKGSFQGPPRDMMIYDEEPRSDIRQENMMRMTTAEKFRELYCMTHTKGLTWVRQEVFDNEETNRKYKTEHWEIASVTNKRANMSVLDTILANITDYNEIQMRLLGRSLSLSGRIYSMFSPRVHVIEPFKITKDDFIVYRGGDLHLSKPSVGVFLAVDREENYYVTTSFKDQLDTDSYKQRMHDIAVANDYRLGWTAVDRSTDSTSKVYARRSEDEEGRNIYKEISRGKYAIPAIKKSAKYPGSIKAGVDHIIKLLKCIYGPEQNLPKLFIFNVPENKDLIQSFKNLERDEGANEDRTGAIDKIAEGKHDKHAALRYIFQRTPRYIAPGYGQDLRDYEPDNEKVNY